MSCYQPRTTPSGDPTTGPPQSPRRWLSRRAQCRRDAERLHWTPANGQSCSSGWLIERHRTPLNGRPATGVKRPRVQIPAARPGKRSSQVQSGPVLRSFTVTARIQIGSDTAPGLVPCAQRGRTRPVRSRLALRSTPRSARRVELGRASQALALAGLSPKSENKSGPYRAIVTGLTQSA